MDINQLKSNFSALSEQIKQATAQMSANSRMLVESAANAMFEAAPEITEVFWVQYTPYFNDGEPCSFSRHDLYYVLEWDKLDDDESEGSYLHSEEDYQRALSNLEAVKSYVADPKAWLEKIRATRKIPDHARPEWYAPWPATVERALEEIANIELQRTLVSPEDAKRIIAAFEEFSSAVLLIPDEILRTVYGDHIKVSITKDGTSVDEYSHD